jgi:hypothetical protein
MYLEKLPFLLFWDRNVLYSMKQCRSWMVFVFSKMATVNFFKFFLKFTDLQHLIDTSLGTLVCL